MKKLLERWGLWQFFTYGIVGGLAALVEWGCFYVFNTPLGLSVSLSTILAFLFSTFANWILGRLLTFKGARSKSDILPVYFVSAVGLGMNLLLMALFTGPWAFPALPSKIVSTGIVFFWNYFSRKYLIYKDKRHE